MYNLYRVVTHVSNDAEKRKIQKCIICTELQTNQKRLRRENYKMHNLYRQINHVSNKAEKRKENCNEKKI